jgi:Tol biopolymer transport system component
MNPLGRKNIAMTLLQVVVVSVVSVLAVRLLDRPKSEPPLVKFRITAPGTDAPRSPALSPDGRMIAYLAGDRLWIQTLGELEPREVKVDAGASGLFWSPDGRHIGYLSGTRIMKVSVGGGENQVLSDTRASFSGGEGAWWGEKGNIIFSRGDTAGVLEVPALGGDPHRLVPIDTSETDLHEPSYLPGDRGILFSSHRRHGGIDNIGLWADGRRRVLLELPGQTVSTPVYSRTGHILFRRSPVTSGIWAVPFSLKGLKVTGDPFLVAPLGARPSVSSAGWLAFSGSDASGAKQLILIDRAGKELGAVGEAQQVSGVVPALSRGDGRVANSVTDGDNEDIWIYDPTRGTRTRLTFEPGGESGPAWSPDGALIAYQSNPTGCVGRPECYSIRVRPADGTGITDSIGPGIFPNFSPDGRALIYTVFGGATGFIGSLVGVPLEGERLPFTVVRGNPIATEGRVRPGGDLMAYMSNESGEWQVYLTRYPSGEGRWQVSVAGGEWPRWNAAGDRLWFAQGEDVMEVAVSGTGSPTLSRPERLFSRVPTGQWAFGWHSGFDVSGDGSRFVINRPSGDRARPPAIMVVQNWYSEFKKRK